MIEVSDQVPVNVKLEYPTEAPEEWDEEANQWIDLNGRAGGNPQFYPLTIKAAYVIGAIHCLCQSVSILLKDDNAKLVSYIPAYGIFASGVELFGRCLRGNSNLRGSGNDISIGFKWLASTSLDDYKDDYESVPENIVFVQTNHYMYSIKNLVALRHFAAHGQATSHEIGKGAYAFGYIDYEILSHMPTYIAAGLERYWKELQTSAELCNRLAAANVITLRHWPISQSWALFEADQKGVYHSVEEIFNRFDWHV